MECSIMHAFVNNPGQSKAVSEYTVRHSARQAAPGCEHLMDVRERISAGMQQMTRRLVF
jgi:hypothetical protein